MSASITIAVLLSRANARAWLALTSAFAQSYKGCEILISDNCSGIDHALLAGLASSSPFPVRIVKHEDKLPVWDHVLFCYRNSNTEYFIFLGDDDLLTPYGIELLLKSIIENGSDFAFGIRHSNEVAGFNFVQFVRLFLPTTKGDVNIIGSLDRSKAYYFYSLISSFTFPFYSAFRRPALGVLEDVYRFISARPMLNYFDDHLLIFHLVRQDNFSLVGTVCYSYDNSNWGSQKDIDVMTTRLSSMQPGLSEDRSTKETRKNVLLCHLIDCLVTLPAIASDQPDGDRRLFIIKFAHAISKYSSLFGFFERNRLYWVPVSCRSARNFIDKVLSMSSIDTEMKLKLMQYYSSVVDVNRPMNWQFSIVDLVVARLLYSRVYVRMRDWVYFLRWVGGVR